MDRLVRFSLVFVFLLSIVSVPLLVSVPSVLASNYEDLEAYYTERDDDAEISLSSYTCTLDDIDDDDEEWVVRDFGTGAWDSDFVHEFEFRVTYPASTTSASWYPWCLSNNLDSMENLFSGGDAMWFRLNIGSSWQRGFLECRIASTTKTAWGDTGIFAIGTTYYIRIERDDDYGDHGRLYMTAFTGGFDVTQVEYLYIDLPAELDFRYLYVWNNYQYTGSSATDRDGFNRNYELYGVSPEISTSEATLVTETTARLHANVDDSGTLPSTVTFYWGDNDGGEVAENWDNNSEADSPSQPQEEGAAYENVSGLDDNVQYYFTAVATNSYGSGWGDTQTFTTLETGATADLSIVDQTDTTMDLVWTKGGSAEKTLIRYSNVSTPTSTSSGFLGYFGTGSSTTVTTLSPGTRYYFSAWGYTDADGYSDTYETADDYTLPSTPEFISATVASDTRIDLTWSLGDGGDQVVVRHSTYSYPTLVTGGSSTYSGSATAYNHTGLTPSVTYYYSIWAYDSDSGYYSDYYDTITPGGTTLDNPDIDTKAATGISISTAYLNALVIDDGGEGCYVRFQYGETDSYGTNTAWITPYYDGDSPQQFISGLSLNTTYHFRAQIYNSINGSGSPVSGDDMTFTTSSDVGDVTNFMITADPLSGTEVYLQWTKADGSLYTIIRYREGSYPAGYEEGDSAYYGEYTASKLEGLDPGTTYYFSAWGYAPEDYSDTVANGICTTYAQAPEDEDDFTPEVPQQIEDPGTYGGMPGYALAAWIAEESGMPVASLMAFGLFVFFFCLALIFYKVTGEIAVLIGVMLIGFALMGYMGFGLVGAAGAILLVLFGGGYVYITRHG